MMLVLVLVLRLVVDWVRLVRLAHTILLETECATLKR